MRVLIATIAILASSYAHVLLHSPELRTLENELLLKHYDQIQQWQDETREAAEQAANVAEEAKWDALESTYDTTWSNNHIVNVVPIAQPLTEPKLVSEVLAPFSKTIVSQSLSQTHPGPAIVAQPIIVNQQTPEECSPVAPAAEAIYSELLPQTNLPSSGYSSWLEPTVEISEPALEIVPATTIVKPSTKTIVTQSLSQTHPAPVSDYVVAQPSFTVANPNIAVVDPVLAYTSAVVKPETKTIVSQSLTQTHPSPIVDYSASHQAFAIPEHSISLSDANLAYKTTLIKPETETIVSHSLSQTHPSPLTSYIAAQPAPSIVEPAIVEPVLSYESSVIQPATKTIVSQSLSQSHPPKTWSPDSLVATW